MRRALLILSALCLLGGLGGGVITVMLHSAWTVAMDRWAGRIIEMERVARRTDAESHERMQQLKMYTDADMEEAVDRKDERNLAAAGSACGLLTGAVLLYLARRRKAA